MGGGWCMKKTPKPPSAQASPQQFSTDLSGPIAQLVGDSQVRSGCIMLDLVVDVVDVRSNIDVY